MNLRFYHCEICGKIITVLSGDSVPTECCGQTMEEIIPNRTDGANEKHVPVFRKEGDILHVCIGSVPHPMLNNHSITWIGLRTAEGFQFKELHPGDRPEACFSVRPGDRVEGAYAFCDCHGLWYSEMEDKS